MRKATQQQTTKPETNGRPKKKRTQPPKAEQETNGPPKKVGRPSKVELAEQLARENPTRGQYDKLDLIYAYFNEKLFGGELPNCILTFNARSARAAGFFAARDWEHKDDNTDETSLKTHEISLNPNCLNRPPRSTMATLVHEMVHLWQYVFGKPTRNGYHNTEWADKMESIGLLPTNTGEIGGRRTGQKVTHWIIDDGPYAQAFAKLPPEYALYWTSGRTPKDGTPKKNKVKYTCPECDRNVWAKPDDMEGSLLCNHGDAENEPVYYVRSGAAETEA
jgi:predicted SprT family Zn-dependent metalloprotease